MKLNSKSPDAPSMSNTGGVRVFRCATGTAARGAATGEIAQASTDESVFERSMPSDSIRGWIPVRVKKTRQNKGLEPPF